MPATKTDEEVHVFPSRLSRPVGSCGPLVIVLLFSWWSLAVASSAAFEPALQSGGSGEMIFQTKCAGCHTIGKGKMVGPDLQGVTERRDPLWIHGFILNPDQMFAANDPTAQQLLAEYNNVKMPALGLTSADVDAVIAYLQSGRAAGSAAPSTTQPASVPGYAANGQRLFTGEQPLANGGPPCLACHSVSGTGALGGGGLGPDLTHVFQRYGGSQGLTPILTTIAFPTMVGPFAGHALTPAEVADLAVFFQREDSSRPPVAAFAAGSLTPDVWRQLAIGLAGGAFLTVLLFLAWPRQKQSISARLRGSARKDDV